METTLKDEDLLRSGAAGNSGRQKVVETTIDQHGDLWLHAQGTDSFGSSTPTRFLVFSRAVA